MTALRRESGASDAANHLYLPWISWESFEFISIGMLWAWTSSNFHYFLRNYMHHVYFCNFLKKITFWRLLTLWSLFKVKLSSYVKTGSQLDRRHPWNAQKLWRVGWERKKVNGMIGELITVDLKANETSKMHTRMLCDWGRHKSIMQCWKFGCATWYVWHYSNLGAQLNWRRTIICDKLIEKKCKGFA